MALGPQHTQLPALAPHLVSWLSRCFGFTAPGRGTHATRPPHSQLLWLLAAALAGPGHGSHGTRPRLSRSTVTLSRCGPEQEAAAVNQKL
ncbi:hypothetical protein NDU88_003201 [Pleurodeles waltl]|uniref:Uncharacterized protein n=1 Tax=Pleurodeles waltl TaxID=8319 RepID=A0AAV7NFX8_PLEWA|nr:hypothetical protein NDU88_003201 [Pleurodeles waltl]